MLQWKCGREVIVDVVGRQAIRMGDSSVVDDVLWKESVYRLENWRQNG